MAVEVELDGAIYVWTGTRWLGKRDYMAPPVAILERWDEEYAERILGFLERNFGR